MSIAAANRGDFIDERPVLWQQGLYEESSTQKAPLGAIRTLSDGREFIYVQAGTSNLAAGQVCQSEAPDVANLANLAVTANQAAGNKVIAFTLGNSNTANVANAFKDGWAYINTGAGNGTCYKINHHAAIAANANGNLYLYDKIRIAITTSSKVSLGKHKCKQVIKAAAAPTGTLVGVPTFTVTANYYAWIQKKGECAVEVDGTVVNGDKVICAATGCVGPSANGSETEITVGKCMANNANDHWALVDLDL